MKDYDRWLNKDNPDEQDDFPIELEIELDDIEPYVSPALERANENLMFGGVTLRDVRE